MTTAISAKPETERDVEIKLAYLRKRVLRKPVGVFLHLRRDRHDRTIGEQRLQIDGFERIRAHFHAALVDLSIERVQQILAVAPVTRQPALWRGRRRFVLDDDGDLRETRRLDVADNLVDPFTLDKRIDQQSNAQRAARARAARS
jgi:hypothetical protein